MNKQPFYHRATILFTGTTEITEDELTDALEEGLRILKKKYVKNSAQVEELEEPQPGDPADLMS